MNRNDMLAWWDHFRTVNGITLRIIQSVPKDKIDTRLVKDMRTPKELIAHMYNTMREMAEGAARGEIKMTDEMDAAVVAKLKTHDDIVRYAEESWKATDKAIRSMSEAQVNAMVKSPWGRDFPGFVCVNIIYDEHIHHRGQLYAYLRIMGVAPVMMWDFENNAPEYRQKQAQQA